MHASIDELLHAAQIHFHADRLQPAAWKLREVIERDPGHTDALDGLAYIAARQGEHALAADYFDQVILHLPDDARRLSDAAMSNQYAGRFSRAVALLTQLLSRDPGNIVTMHALAMAHIAAGELSAARAVFERAIARQPQVWQLHYNLARVLGAAGDFDAEMLACQRAIQLKPDCIDAYVNLGVALRDQHRFDEALKVFRKAVQIDATHPAPRTNRSQTNLLLGEFAHGWREYEWRWRDGVQQHDVQAPLWLGDASLEGKAIFLHAEQGFGDTLQFLRYIPMVAARGARIVLRVQQALVTLLSGLPHVAEVLGDEDRERSANVVCDYQCPLMSLPFAFKSDARSIPADVPYLQADSPRCAQWQRWWQSQAGAERRRVGLVWSGRPSHVNDRNRSMSLDAWTALAGHAEAWGLTLVSLQKEVREADRIRLQTMPQLADVSALLHDFADTAALISTLDLVICVDTAVAHLAGALGKPVWVLLPYTPDWRWQLGRSDSPWYPTMRLFRQTTRGDWRSVIAGVQAALQA